MFQLDVRTLLVVLALNCLMAAVALPIIMGSRASRAARWAQTVVALQALTWVALLLSGLWFGTWIDRMLSVLGVGALAGSWLAMLLALEGWLGPRHGLRTMKALAVLIPLGYGLGFGSYPFRVGWSNLLLSLQLLILAIATVRPRPASGQHWRRLLLGCFVSLAVVTAWRGVLGAFFTAAYPNFLTPHRANLASAIGSNIALVLSVVALLVAWREEAERQLQSQALTDGLTGVLNRRAWTEAARLRVAEAQRHGRPLVILMIDLDHFKGINDLHGHESGDRALQLLAGLLRQHVRAGDLVGRYGGEEFCLLLHHTDREQARSLDLRLRVALAEQAPGQLDLTVGFSAGLAELGPDTPDLESLLRRADQALYEAKRQGRGRLWAAAA